MTELWERFLEVASSSSTSDESKGATAFDVIFQEGSLRLVRYRSENARRLAEPIVICFSLVNRPMQCGGKHTQDNAQPPVKAWKEPR